MVGGEVVGSTGGSPPQFNIGTCSPARRASASGGVAGTPAAAAAVYAPPPSAAEFRARASAAASQSREGRPLCDQHVKCEQCVAPRTWGQFGLWPAGSFGSQVPCDQLLADFCNCVGLVFRFTPRPMTVSPTLGRSMLCHHRRRAPTVSAIPTVQGAVTSVPTRDSRSRQCGHDDKLRRR